jgi:Putative regulator of cell autolysis
MALFYKNRLGKRLFLTLIALALAAAAVYIFNRMDDDGRKPPIVQKGLLDLSTWDFNQDGLIKLDGQWEFYWNRFLDDEHFRHDPNVRPDTLAKVPGMWNNYLIDGNKIPGHGYGTYKLSIKTRETDPRLSLKILAPSTAYRLYVNDELLASGGTAGKEKGNTSADYRPQTIEFSPPGQTFDLIVQVANFDFARGGMSRSLFLGYSDAMQALNNGLIYKDLFLLGSLVIAIFYSLSMFLMNRDEKISLYFSFVCMILVGRILISGSYFIYELFPHASVNVMEYINYFTSHWGSLAFALMIRELFPDMFSNQARRYFIVLTVIALVFITVVPMNIYSQFVIPSDILILMIIGYACYVTARAVIRKKPYSMLSFLANGLCLVLVVFDLVFAITNKNSAFGEFSTLGFFTFIFLYAFILGRKFSISFKEVRILSHRLLELDKLKDEFLAKTSHELSTPLNGIISITESLVEGVEGKLNKNQIMNLNLVASSGRRLANLIQDILDISKLEHGDIVLHTKSIPVQPLVESVLLVFEQMYANKAIKWRYEFPQSLPTVHADENRLVQILYNLIGNAAKFTDRGEIKVSAEAQDERVVIRVSDTGKGIQPEKSEAIFKPFEQADSSLSREYGGVGLGLSITKHLVELHGGRIEVVSEPDQGSSFTFTLPIGDTSVLEPTAPLISASQYTETKREADNEQAIVLKQQGEHILLVDDNYTNLQAALNLLKLEKYSVTAVSSGKMALEALKANPDFSLVILDVMMPEITGYEVCRKIRETRTLFEIPVLLVTAQHQPEDLVLGFQAGANDFLVKPYEPMEFKARVKTLIELNKSMSKALKSEVAFLQAQIKPHFLFNSLNTISYFCTRDGAKAEELLNNFSMYLRSSFDFKNLETYIPLEKELEFVSVYLEIEQARFGNRLEAKLNVEPETLNQMILPLTLQPLVENAILHGIMKKIEGGYVEVSVKLQNEELQFRIRDTGVGMSPDEIKELFTRRDGQGIGLRNIEARLQKWYGRGIRITSEVGKGTEVSFTIPISEGAFKRE